MEPSFIALGAALLAATLLPLVHGLRARATSLAYLAALALGIGLDASRGAVLVSAAASALAALLAAMAMAGLRHRLAPQANPHR